MGQISVVIATRNRSTELRRTLERLSALPERPAVLVVDNASCDATARMVRGAFPAVQLVTLSSNLGAAARNVGVACAKTPYVAFSDDDSWWAPGALGSAVALLERHPRLGLLAARTLVGPHGQTDETSLLMYRSPLRVARPLPGPAVLGFLACSAVVRREAFLEAGGFAGMLLVGGEERLLAYDLVRAGWDLAYVHEIVAHHHPSALRDADRRRALVMRNDLLVDWLRRGPAAAARSLAGVLRAAAAGDAESRRALIQAVALAARERPRRAPLPAGAERAARTLEAWSGERSR